jgi:16S rRNA (guanine966-N2)-methyltransferase
LAIESLKQERMEERYGVLIRYNQKDYGDKYLNMFCHESAIEQEEADE